MVPCLFLPFGATFQSLASTSHAKELSPDLGGMETHLAPSRLLGSLLSLKPPWASQSQQDPRVLGRYSVMDGIIVGAYSELGRITLGGGCSVLEGCPLSHGAHHSYPRIRPPHSPNPRDNSRWQFLTVLYY